MVDPTRTFVLPIAICKAHMKPRPSVHCMRLTNAARLCSDSSGRVEVTHRGFEIA